MNTEKKISQLTKTPLNIKQVNIGKHTINYVVVGKGEPVLLIHGANIGWGQWYANIAALATVFTVYAIDLPGAGRSSGLDYQKADLVQEFVGVVSRFIDKLNIPKVHIIGHSIGAWVALKLASTNTKTVGKIVLVNPVGFTLNTPLNQKFIGIKPLVNFLAKTLMKPTKRNIEFFLASGFKDKNKLKSELLNYYLERVAKDGRSHPLKLVNSMTGFSRVNPIFFLGEEVQKVQNPVLIISGKYDPLVPPNTEHLTRFKIIPDVKIEIFNDSAHVPFIEEDEKFDSTVINFLMESRAHV